MVSPNNRKARAAFNRVAEILDDMSEADRQAALRLVVAAYQPPLTAPDFRVVVVPHEPTSSAAGVPFTPGIHYAGVTA